MKKLTICLFFVIAAVIFVFSGCSISDVQKAAGKYRENEMSSEDISKIEETLIFSAQVLDSSQNELIKSNGEPITVLAAYETATGGEPRINSNGVLETYAVGEVVTYKEGTPVTNADGTEETYAGGEPVTDALGIPYPDIDGHAATRAPGEVVTHGSDDIVYDSEGKKVTYNGESMTYAAGEDKYSTDGKRQTVAITPKTDENGQIILNHYGLPEYDAVEVVTDEAGDPIINENEEVETKQINPKPPERVIEPPLEAGTYYINSITSAYVFLDSVEVNAANIPVFEEESSSSVWNNKNKEEESKADGESGDSISADATEEEESSTEETTTEEETSVEETASAEIEADNIEKIDNLQLEILGENLKGLKMCIDAEGYAYFMAEDSGKVLTITGDIKNGSNLAFEEIVKIPYPQYKYHDDPEFTVADNQKWILKEVEEEEGVYYILSFADQRYAITVDDQYGTQYANIMIWKYDGRDLQKFNFSSDVPKIERYVEEGLHFIECGATDAMLLSLGDMNYEDERYAYIYTSDRGDGQLIKIVYDEYGFAYLMHNDSTKALTVISGEARTGNYVCQYEFDGGDWQRWIISPNPYGGYYIRSALNVSEVLDLSEGFRRCGNKIMLNWNNEEATAQNWKIIDDAPYSPYVFDYMDTYAQYYSSATNYLILVNTYNCVVCVYYGSQGAWENIGVFSCVTGKSETPTVKGEFVIYYRMPYFDGNEDSEEWYTCYYATGFYPSYFFHSIIYYQGTMDVMDDSMGYNGSHGCVRLYTDNAEWIYNTITDGTKVVVY